MFFVFLCALVSLWLLFWLSTFEKRYWFFFCYFF
jgi:hypothetical protein